MNDPVAQDFLTMPNYIAIDTAMDKDNELTTLHLKDEIVTDLNISESTIARARRELGWVHQTPKYCQLVREVNKGVRLDWAEKLITDNEMFEDVIFTDESSFQVEHHKSRAYRRIGEPRIL